MKSLKQSVKVVFLLTILLGVGSVEARAQNNWNWWPFKINRFDQAGKFHGRWKVYLGEGKDKVLIRDGKFKHGKEVGVWRYYYPNGTLYIYEVHDRNSNAHTVKRYHENGNLKMEGQAITISNGVGTNHYWYGEWKVYDEQGKFSHTEVYNYGNLVSRKE